MVDVNLLPAEYKKRKGVLKIIFSKTGGAVLILVILSLLLYGGLLFYQNGLKEDLNAIKEEIAILDLKRDVEMETAIVDLDEKLGVLKGLFEDHLYWSRLLSKIEQLTIPRAYFSNAKVYLLNEKINITFSGNASSYTNLARQILSFQEEPFVESVKVSGISLSTRGGIDFSLLVIFSKNILLDYD